MKRKGVTENIVRVKTALAEKYERLALVSKSKPRKANLLRVAKRHRQQAANEAKGATR